MIRFETYSPRLLPAVVRFWNRSFASRRNFVPVDERLFRERVVEKRVPGEAFDPEGFILARLGAEVVGLVHVGTRREAAVRSLDPEWRGGSQGYVAFLFVEPAHRRKGIGDALWHRGLDRLRRTRQVVLDGQCLSPYYGNCEGPFTPFWGTPEGPGVDWDDSGTKKFLARKGFAPRFKGVQMALDLSLLPPAPRGSYPGVDLVERAAEYPEVGRDARDRRRVLPGLDFHTVAAVRRGRTVGVLAFFPMSEAKPGLYGIYEATVVEEFRGKALGARLLGAALRSMRARGGTSCEVLALPEVSETAFKLYGRAGFLPVAKWAIY